MKKKQIGTWVGGIIFSVCFLLALLATSFEIGAYGSWDFYEKEYEKYNVTEDLKMEMPDVMNVTKEMMAFLKGDRENLNVPAVVDGEDREFFSPDEISHMEDVKNLFVGGLHLRTWAIVIMAVLIVVGIWQKAPVKQILPKAFQYTTAALAGITAIIAGLFVIDFDKYFVVFHEMFFSQGNWTFDPDVSLMINMLPEDFFADIAARIVIIFAMLFIVSFAIATIIRVKNKKNIRNTYK